ncbi:ethanolamine ammonia-lyase subunit EutC [[Clostridium] colinum]|uniref:ethanolamine ammonia-lyase subunit EutC n=1 Tax=[Clostridium] colinum TaxID=36835 RepID=UPI002024226C|nr:ethanolamine ammonia-lyase subunit EutC [[Clostridium] colinum]
MNENDIKLMVSELLEKMVKGENISQNLNKNNFNEPKKEIYSDGEIEDITKIDLKTTLLIDNPFNRENYLDMKKRTPARLGIGKCGTRYKTISTLRFRADHAAAQDSVFSYVDEEFVRKNGFFPVETLCKNKDTYLTRPDLGRKFSNETAEELKKAIGTGHKVLIMVGDGLSSAAIEANIEDIIPSIKQGFKMYGIECADTIPFVKHCRVAAMDHLGEITGAEVIVLLIGERPGLVTAKSMSAYIAYKPTIGMAEAKRTVISNIHEGGTIPVEAGAHIAELVKIMLDKKASGIDLK